MVALHAVHQLNQDIIVNGLRGLLGRNRTQLHDVSTQWIRNEVYGLGTRLLQDWSGNETTTRLVWERDYYKTGLGMRLEHTPACQWIRNEDYGLGTRLLHVQDWSGNETTTRLVWERDYYMYKTGLGMRPEHTPACHRGSCRRSS